MKVMSPAHQQLESNVRSLLDMIEESKQRRYHGMSLILFGRGMVKLDGFLQKNPKQARAGFMRWLLLLYE